MTLSALYYVSPAAEICAAGNTFGTYFRVTTFGESHGGGVGCIVDGCPPQLPLSEADIQVDLDRRSLCLYIYVYAVPSSGILMFDLSITHLQETGSEPNHYPEEGDRHVPDILWSL